MRNQPPAAPARLPENERPDFRPASLSDEVYTPSPRRSEGRRDQLGGRCPSRVASKTSLPTLNGQRNSNRSLLSMTIHSCIWFKKFQTIFLCPEFLYRPPIPEPTATYNQLVTKSSPECPQKSSWFDEFLSPYPGVFALPH